MQKKENIIQHEIVKWFSQQYPQHRGLLFEINNDSPGGVKQIMKRQAMGMIPGLSDLMFLVPGRGEYAGIEIKGYQSRHSLEHIVTQWEWGKKIRDNGGYWIMTSNIDNITLFIEGLMCREIDFIMGMMKQNQKDIGEAICNADKRGVKSLKIDF
jgi:hypothetical protein